MDIFEGVKTQFGFGCMRLPMIGSKVDIPQTKRMVDAFLDAGFNYFDTAHGYLSGQSEPALKECLTSRYPRDRFFLTDKLSGFFFKKEKDIRPLFKSQLAACGVDYFDFYLMHAQNEDNFAHFVACRAYETAFELKAEGKIRHVGLSFHDRAEVLDKILTAYPEIEVVQIQFNYLDYDDPAIQSKACYDVCVKHGKPIIVMEPVKGGSLIKLPDEAMAIIDGLHLSPANLALRFAASFDEVRMVLSGMSDMVQMEENISFMSERAFRPLSDEEMTATKRIAKEIHQHDFIPCTACRYCVDGCPKHIAIPDLFACMNAKKQFRDWNADYYYSIHTKNGGKASDCIACGHCEKECPQKLPIRALLKELAVTFDKKK